MSVTADLLSAATSVTPWGQILGLTGGLVTGVLNFFQKKEDNKFALAKVEADIRFAIAKGNVDAATLAGELAKAREQGAADAFTASINADAKLPASYRWIDAFRAFTRPGLTWYFTIFFTLLCFMVIRGVGLVYIDHPLSIFCFVSCANLMEMCVTWWFGQRQIDKMTTSWGNSMIKAKISGAPTNKTVVSG